VLIAFHKPFGVLSQFTGDGSPNRALAEFSFPKDVYPIGRLDADSEGLLLLSEEAHWNDRLLHPRHAHEREYWAQVEKIPTPEALARLRQGVTIQGRTTLPCRAWLLEPQPVPMTVPPEELPEPFAHGSQEPGPPDFARTREQFPPLLGGKGPVPSTAAASEGGRRPGEGSGVMTVPAAEGGVHHPQGSWAGTQAAPGVFPRTPPIRFRKSVPDCWLGLELVEGKNRQVRRMTAAVGHPTLRLLRVRIGRLWLGDLPPGQWRILTPEQIALALG